MQVSPYHVVSVKSYVYSYELSVTIAAADMVSVKHLHFGYILCGIIACSLGMFKHHVTFLFALFIVTPFLNSMSQKNMIYLFAVYLMTVSSTQTIQHQIIGWQWTMNCKSWRTKQLWSNLRYYLGLYLKEMRKTTKYIYRCRILRAYASMLNQDMGVYWQVFKDQTGFWDHKTWCTTIW